MLMKKDGAKVLEQNSPLKRFMWDDKPFARKIAIG